MPQLPRSRERLLGVGLLLKAGDAPLAVVEHDPVLARVGDLLDGQRRDTPGVAVAGGEAPRSMSVSASPEITRKGSSPKNSAQARTPPGGAEQLGLVAVGQAIAEVLPDRVREVVQVGDHLVEAVAVEQVEDVLHHRAVEHRHHRLGDLVGQRAQAGAEARREDHRSHQPRGRDQ